MLLKIVYLILCFVLPVLRTFVEVTEEEIEEFAQAGTPTKARETTKTVVFLYKSWRRRIIAAHPSRPHPPELFSKDYARLPSAVTQFFSEIRKFGNCNYRAGTIKTYFAGIARAIKNNDPAMNIYKCPCFAKTVKSVDDLIRNLRASEGPMKKQADMITADHEAELKRLGLLGTETPKALLNTVLFQIATLFGLRGGKELYKVRISQFEFEHVGPCKVKVLFHDNISKGQFDYKLYKQGNVL